MKRIAALLLMLLVLPAGARADMEWWREKWEEEGYYDRCRLEGDRLILMEGVSDLGNCMEEGAEDDPAENTDTDEPLSGWMYFDYCEDPVFHEIELPSTLRRIGDYAFVGYWFREFTLPASLETLGPEAFTYCTIDRLRIEADVPFDQIAGGFYDCWIGAYEVPEDHPRYRTVDGVLFTRDEKTLLLYPDSCKNAHYDVPAGVERIGERAFHNEYLTTISLPVGLKAVDDYAFMGCTRLHAAALPLTVEKLGHHVFAYCVSLELVSLPEGMKAEKTEKDGWAVYYPNDGQFRGDNGDTDKSGEKPEEYYGGNDYFFAPGRLNGFGAPVCVYADPADTVPAFQLGEGEPVFLMDCTDTRVQIRCPLMRSEKYGWVDMENVEYAALETLFSYADFSPLEGAAVWRLPDGKAERRGGLAKLKKDVLTKKQIAELEESDPEHDFYGPFVAFGESLESLYDGDGAFLCPVWDCRITREPDGTQNMYGIVCGRTAEEMLEPIALTNRPGGDAAAYLPAGTQVRILSGNEEGYEVTTGLDTGWVRGDQVMIIPEKQEEKER